MNPIGIYIIFNELPESVVEQSHRFSLLTHIEKGPFP